MIYKLIWSLFSFRFLAFPYFLRQIPCFLRRYLSSIIFFCFIIVSFVSPSFTVYKPHVARVLRDREMGGNMRLGRK